MSPPATDSALPRPIAAIAADQALGARGRCDEELGQTLRCLAASRIRGVTLQLGAGSVALAAWIIDGMDITSRLLMVVEDESLLASARAHIGNDIRVAVHAQPPLQFLADVSRNRVDLVVLDNVAADEALLDAAVSLLNPGGMLCALGSDGEAPASLDETAALLARREDCLLSRLRTPAPLLLAVRTPEDSRPVRRGGRSARQASGRTPVANLR